MSLDGAGVWLDARGTQNPEHAERGIARYIAEHARALVAAEGAAALTIRLDSSRPIPPSLESLVGSGSLAWHTGTRPIGAEVPAIYHVMSPFELAIELDELWPHWAREPGVRTVVTLYDLIPLVHRQWYLDPEPLTAAQYNARLGLIREAHQVLTISRSTADDAVRLLGIPEQRVTVIDSAPTTRLPGLISSDGEAASVVTEALPDVRPGFLLYVGGDDPRKNMEGTIRAYAELPEALRATHQLVIVCRLRWHQARDLRRRARELGIDSGQLVLAGLVSDRELAALYRCCALFVFPSLYEGAGLPILEAMSCGAPVVASETSSIPEILGDERGSFDPSEPAEIAASVREALEEPGALDELRRRSAERVGLFTWERVAERTMEGYERALAVPAAPIRRRRRKRLAVVTPWPPQPTGVASHSRRLVEQLREHADVEVIVPPTEEEIAFDRSLEPEVPLRTDAEFAWLDELQSYDRRLYVLGHSRFHAHAFEALLRHPGVVLAHDVRLVGIYLDLSRRRFGFDPRWIEGKLRDMYGDRLPARDLRLAHYGDLHSRYGLYMSGEVQAHAERMLVHSRFQEGILRLDARRPAPSAIVPHGIPRIELGADGARRGTLVVSYGGVEIRPKRLDLVLAAFADVAGTHTDARLALVGGGPPSETVAIEALAADLGIGDRVELRGRVDDDSYWEILGQADLAVQLRGGVNAGEASGAVCDCIAARVPAIVSDAGWFSELPDGVALPLPEDASAEGLAELMRSAIDDEALRERVAAAQESYAAQTSFERVAQRYVDVLDL